MNFTDKLKEILSWIGSHSQRLSRKGMELPNHLANARIYFYEADSSRLASTYSDIALTVANQNPLVLDAEGKARPAVFIKPDQLFRLEVKDERGELLFTADHVSSRDLT